MLEHFEACQSTLSDKIQIWAKDKKSFNPSRSMSLKSLSSSLSSSFNEAVDMVDKVTASVDNGGSLDDRLRVAASLAAAVEYDIYCFSC